MDDKQLRDTVKVIIDSIFSEKEEADRQKMTEEAITKSTSTINDLTQALAEQKDAFAALETKHNEFVETVATQETTILTLEESKQAVEEELATIKTELETAKAEHATFVATTEESLSELATLKSEMAEIESAKVAEDRFVALEEAGISYKDKEKQVAKIKDMTEEAFESYKEELLAIKEALMDSTAAVVPTEPVEPVVEPVEGASDTPKVALANVAKKTAATITHNTELSTADDIVAKYQKLGQAMAAAIKKDRI
jgi:chromosome segregation ATPase